MPAYVGQPQEGEANVPLSGCVSLCGIFCLGYKDLIAPLYWGIGASYKSSFMIGDNWPSLNWLQLFAVSLPVLI